MFATVCRRQTVNGNKKSVVKMILLVRHNYFALAMASL